MNLICSRVYWKLGIFSVAMFAAPITAYYVARDRLFGGNATYSGGLAAFVANVVLIGYVVAAFMEDQGESPSNKKTKTDTVEERKKDK
jgi:vacuolar ATPase assembly integral membrane protein VMA21